MSASPLHYPASESELEELLSRPTPGVVEALAQLEGDVAVVGAGGKMGPTLARMVRRALDELGGMRQVFAVSRFSAPEAARALYAAGVQVIRCDLTDRLAVARLPEVANVVFMAGQKFGTTGDPAGTWMTNTVVPAYVAERYRGARQVAFSTGNVYPLVALARGGAREEDPPAPAGEYAWSCLGRERVLSWFAARHHSPLAIVRLNYAVELRYGVLVDLARAIIEGTAIDLAMGHVNVVWQGDANAWAVRALAHAAEPPFVVNVTGREVLAVRDLAARLGERLGRTPILVGAPAPDALLSDASRAHALFGPPTVAVDTMLDWVARWVSEGRPLLGKPTHFEVRDGVF